MIVARAELRGVAALGLARLDAGERVLRLADVADPRERGVLVLVRRTHAARCLEQSAAKCCGAELLLLQQG